MGSGLCRGVFLKALILWFLFFLCHSCQSTFPVQYISLCSSQVLVLVALPQSPEGLNLSPIVFLLSLNPINLFSSNIILFFTVPRDA